MWWSWSLMHSVLVNALRVNFFNVILLNRDKNYLTINTRKNNKEDKKSIRQLVDDRPSVGFVERDKIWPKLRWQLEWRIRSRWRSWQWSPFPALSHSRSSLCQLLRWSAAKDPTHICQRSSLLLDLCDCRSKSQLFYWFLVIIFLNDSYQNKALWSK